VQIHSYKGGENQEYQGSVYQESPNKIEIEKEIDWVSGDGIDSICHEVTGRSLVDAQTPGSPQGSQCQNTDSQTQNY
jgi:hypothetical protein